MVLIRVASAAAAAIAQPVEWVANSRWNTYPLGRAPRGTREEYLRLAAEERARDYPEVDAYEARLGAAVDADWLHDLALHTQVTIKAAGVCYVHGRLLYATLRAYLERTAPRGVSILETGTARGFSALCMARALDDAGVAGTIVTHDVLPHDRAMYWNCIDDADGPRSRAELLRPWQELVERYLMFRQGDTRRELSKLYVPRVHFAFLDGAHTYDYVMREFDSLRTRQHAGDMVFFDDYNASKFPGVVQAVDEICRRDGYDAEVLSSGGDRRYVVATRR